LKPAEDSILPVFLHPNTPGKLARMGRDVENPVFARGENPVFARGENPVFARGENPVLARGYDYHVEDRVLIPQNKTMVFD
jgi:formyltetrahydrofolate hydrolase